MRDESRLRYFALLSICSFLARDPHLYKSKSLIFYYRKGFLGQFWVFSLKEFRREDSAGATLHYLQMVLLENAVKGALGNLSFTLRVLRNSLY